METGIGLLSAALGCGLAAAMAWLAIDGLFRLTFRELGGAASHPPRPLARSAEVNSAPLAARCLDL